MNKNIVFFNRFHNGDLHISREIVRKIINKVKQINTNINFSYSHCNDANLLSDIEYLNYLPLSNVDQFSNLFEINNNIYINTWYGQQNFKYMNKYGMTIDCLYESLDDTCKSLWNFSLNDVSSNIMDFYPTINYDTFKIDNIKTWLATDDRVKIFVSNGSALSGQATNFPMTPIICDLANNHTDKIFILSNREPINQILPNNVVYSSDIIKKSNGSDLNENSFITTFCSTIIGRASGAFSYAWTQQNMFQRNVKFICFCGPGVVEYGNHKFWTNVLSSDKINYLAEFIVSHDTNSSSVYNMINNHI